MWDNLRIIKYMERVFLSEKMAVNMKVTLKMIKETDLVPGLGQIEPSIQASTKIEKDGEGTHKNQCGHEVKSVWETEKKLNRLKINIFTIFNFKDSLN